MSKHDISYFNKEISVTIVENDKYSSRPDAIICHKIPSDKRDRHW